MLKRLIVDGSYHANVAVYTGHGSYFNINWDVKGLDLFRFSVFKEIAPFREAKLHAMGVYPGSANSCFPGVLRPCAHRPYCCVDARPDSRPLKLTSD